MLRRHQRVAVHAGTVLPLPARHLRRGSGRWDLGPVQQRPGGGGRHGVLQTDVLQLQTDQTGSAEGNSPPHPLRTELLRTDGNGDRRRQGHLSREGRTPRHHELSDRHRRGVQHQAAHRWRCRHRHWDRHDLRDDLQHDALLRHQEIQRLRLNRPNRRSVSNSPVALELMRVY